MRTSIRLFDIPSPAVILRCGNALLRLCSPKFHGAGSACEPRQEEYVLDGKELSPAHPPVYTVNINEIRLEFRNAALLWASLALLIVGFAVLMLVNGMVNANLPLTIFSAIMAAAFTGLLIGILLYRYAMYCRCIKACEERLRRFAESGDDA